MRIFTFWCFNRELKATTQEREAEVSDSLNKLVEDTGVQGGLKACTKCAPLPQVCSVGCRSSAFKSLCSKTTNQSRPPPLELYVLDLDSLDVRICVKHQQLSMTKQETNRHVADVKHGLEVLKQRSEALRIQVRECRKGLREFHELKLCAFLLGRLGRLPRRKLPSSRTLRR